MAFDTSPLGKVNALCLTQPSQEVEGPSVAAAAAVPEGSEVEGGGGSGCSETRLDGQSLSFFFFIAFGCSKLEFDAALTLLVNTPLSVFMLVLHVCVCCQANATALGARWRPRGKKEAGGLRRRRRSLFRKKENNHWRTGRPLLLLLVWLGEGAGRALSGWLNDV